MKSPHHCFVTLFAAVGCLLAVGCFGRNNTVEEVTPGDPSSVADAAPVEPPEGSWPWWRGPQGNGHVDSPLPPTQWSGDENITWQTDLPGRGHSTPVIWGEKIFLTTADEDEHTQSLICLNRATGSELWNTTVHDGPLLLKHDKNSQASPSPAVDGERVFTLFPVNGSVWCSAVDFDGEIVWQASLGDFYSKHGYGASPVIYKSVVIAVIDHLGTGYVVALDRASGDVVWRKKRDRGASFATPIVANTSGRDQLIVTGQHKVVSYDPTSGEEIWRCDATTESTANTPVVHGDMVFVSGGYPDHGIYGIRTDGEGDVTDSHLEWEDGKKMYVPTPTIVDGRLVCVLDSGVVNCYDAETGKRHWAERLGGDVSASPTVVEGVCFLPNEQGTMHIFRAGDEFESIAEVDLGGACFASPVIVEGQIFQRTESALLCIGQRQQDVN